MNNPIRCGDANPNGNVSLSFKGGCGKEVDFDDMYRCTGCGGRFHRECIFDHFEFEEGHSVAHRSLHKIREKVKRDMRHCHMKEAILIFCRQGLSRERQKISFIP